MRIGKSSKIFVESEGPGSAFRWAALVGVLLALAWCGPAEAQEGLVHLVWSEEGSGRPALDGWEVQVAAGTDSAAVAAFTDPDTHLTPRDSTSLQLTLPIADCDTPHYYRARVRPQGPWSQPAPWETVTPITRLECPEVIAPPPTIDRWEVTYVESDRIAASIEITSGDPGPRLSYQLEPDSVVWYELAWADTSEVDEDGLRWGVKHVDEDGEEWDLLAADTVIPQPAADSLLARLAAGEGFAPADGGIAAFAYSYRVVDARDADTGAEVGWPEWTEYVDSARVVRTAWGGFPEPEPEPEPDPDPELLFVEEFDDWPGWEVISQGSPEIHDGRMTSGTATGVALGPEHPADVEIRYRIVHLGSENFGGPAVRASGPMSSLAGVSPVYGERAEAFQIRQWQSGTAQVLVTTDGPRLEIGDTAEVVFRVVGDEATLQVGDRVPVTATVEVTGPGRVGWRSIGVEDPANQGSQLDRLEAHALGSGATTSAAGLSQDLMMASMATEVEPLEWPAPGMVGELTVYHYPASGGPRLPEGTRVELIVTPDSPEDEGWGVQVLEVPPDSDPTLEGGLFRVPTVKMREARAA